jgi:hypothetical protein
MLFEDLQPKSSDFDDDIHICLVIVPYLLVVVFRSIFCESIGVDGSLETLTIDLSILCTWCQIRDLSKFRSS